MACIHLHRLEHFHVRVIYPVVAYLSIGQWGTKTQPSSLSDSRRYAFAALPHTLLPNH